MAGAPEDHLVDFILDCQASDFDPAIRGKAVHCLVDALTLAKLARAHPVVAAVASLCTAGVTGPRMARTWTDGTLLPVSEAVLLNAVAAHAFFQDDTDMASWAHPGSLVPAVALGLAEAEGLGLRQALRGMVAGYATLSWVGGGGEVSRQIVERGFRGSAVLGPICAAAAAAATLGLDRRQTLSAIAIATDTTGGMLEPVRSGAQDWRLQNGFASQRGVMAALLARAGVRGPERPLTGKSGFLACFTDFRDGALPALWAGGPQAAAIHNVWFKPYATIGDNMAPVVAAAQLTGTIPDLSAVRSIRILMNAHFADYPGVRFAGPFVHVEQMMTSVALAVAALIVHGDLQYRQFAGLAHDATVLSLVDKAVIVPVEDMGYLDGVVEVETDGETYRASMETMPPTVFFRDDETTRTVVRSRLSGSSAPYDMLLPLAGQGAPDIGFDALYRALHG